MEAESSQSGNRLFLIIAVALIGLICIGLFGLGFVLTITSFNRAQEQAALIPTATDTPFPPTFTPTPTATFTPTETPQPTPTGTPVVRPESEVTATPAEVEAAATGSSELSGTATNTPVVGSPTAVATVNATATPAVVPGSGGVLPVASSGILVWLGGGVLALLVLSGALHRMSTNGSRHKNL
ncbi:MAG: hypothetical protein FOGNACKC_02755 [Anaerolineae bacterium]|nr:hypothetical protein [Anaerolineae bacterium]